MIVFSSFVISHNYGADNIHDYVYFYKLVKLIGIFKSYNSNFLISKI